MAGCVFAIPGPVFRLFLRKTAFPTAVREGPGGLARQDVGRSFGVSLFADEARFGPDETAPADPCWGFPMGTPLPNSFENTSRELRLLVWPLSSPKGLENLRLSDHAGRPRLRSASRFFLEDHFGQEVTPRANSILHVC